MLQGLFGRSGDKPKRKRKSHDALNTASVEQVLANLACQMPDEPRWVALIRADGILLGCIPSQASIGENRISAMSAAAFSLGERITNELRHGQVRYAMIAATEGIHLLIVLNGDFLLAFGLPPVKSFGAVFDVLQEAVLPVLRLIDEDAL